MNDYDWPISYQVPRRLAYDQGLVADIGTTNDKTVHDESYKKWSVVGLADGSGSKPLETTSNAINCCRLISIA